MSSGNGIETLSVSVAYATPAEQMWRELDVPAGSTIRDAIEASGILAEFPEIDLGINKVGIFGTIASLDTVLSDEDRVEIYRPIRVDPVLIPKKKYKLRKVEPLVETPGTTVKMTVPDEKQIYKEEGRVTLAAELSEYGFVVKVDVTDLDRSLAWYREKLGFEVDERYSAGSWRQLTLPELPNTALGLYHNPDGAGLGGKKATFVVKDIDALRDSLIREGVEVDEVVELGEWVKLAFLKDPDGNVFGIRQNMSTNAAGSAE